MGWGLVDLRRVLFCDPERRRMRFWDVRHADGVRSEDVVGHRVTVVDGSEPLQVSLAWTDRPGTLGADDPVVNDLDLEVTSPGGTRFVGNVFRDGVSVPGGGDADRRNNVEMVLVERPEPGAWTLEVRAHAVNSGDRPGQGFALVASGHLGADD
jgi:hypothetical protein